ncbi:MAG: glycosyltransferase, partial [Ruminococcus sp.]|nr:glycosyltransferase [Ruminococcus sp.]
HIKFNQILAWYRAADVFLCMSEHEGFCVPLVEAMFFDVPIVAYDSSAIADTLGGSGILIKDNDPLFTAMVIDRLVNDSKLRESVLVKQRNRLEDFQYEKIRAMFEGYLTKFIGK